MDCETIQQCLIQTRPTDYMALIAAIAAIVAAACAYLSYRQSKNIYDEIISDQVIIPGPLHHPDLDEIKHKECVICCTLFNKSHKNAYINTVIAFDENNQQIPITWSDEINKHGKIVNPTGLLGIKDNIDLCIRRDDGVEFKKSSVKITNSFNDKVIELHFDPYQDLWKKGS